MTEKAEGTPMPNPARVPERDLLLADRYPLADRFPTMYEDDRPPQTFEPLLDRIQREIADLRSDERLALFHWLGTFDV